MSGSGDNLPEADSSEDRLSPSQLEEPCLQGPCQEPCSEAALSESPLSQLRQTRSFIRAFSATNYLLGKRGAALAEGLSLADLPSRELLAEVTEQLSHGVQAQRARVLAAEVGRLMRSLSTQKLK